MPPTRPSPRSGAGYGLGVAALCLVTLLAFSPAISAPLLFDDTTAIDHNPTITRLWPPSVPLAPPRESPLTGRPVANYSLAINYGLNRALGVDQSHDPGGPEKTISYHLLNIALHLTSGLLLFGIVWRTIRLGRFGGRATQHPERIALVVAAIWLLHPLQTEAVDYLTQRTELLVSLCYLALLYCSIRAWDAATMATRSRWYVAAVVACALGMGSKEVMVSAPLMVVLYDRAFRLDAWRELRAPTLRSRRWFYGGLFATLVLLAVLVASAHRSSAGLATGMSSLAYLNSQGWAIPHYLLLAIWPVGFTIDYGQQPLPAWHGVPGLLLLSALGAATLFAWTRISRWGWLAFSGAWFFCLLAPSSSFVPVATEIAAERRIYLAFAAVVVLVVIGLDQAASRLRSPRAAGAVAVSAVMLLAVLTFRRSQLYQHPEAIWRAAIASQPGNARAWNNLGQLLADAPIPESAAADSLFRQAVHLDSSYVPALYNLASSAIDRRQFADAEQLLQRTVSLAPDDQPALARLGSVLALRGDGAAALPYLEHAVELQPDDVGALMTLGIVKAGAGRTAEAVDLFNRVLRIDPGNEGARTSLARLVP